MRIKGLDFLRGIAILAVLCRHSEMQNVLKVAGGYGVDLFFVLSGFLVTGLLLNEYQKTGKVNAGRFLIRRGFKIYPAFYFYLVVSLWVDTLFFKRTIGTDSILSEALFLQSYWYPIRFHTWSLAVEGHFYILISLFIVLAVSFNWLRSKITFPLILTVLIALVAGLRIAYCIPFIGQPQPAIFATHLRMDGLLTGALLAYLWYFKNEVFNVVYRNRILFTMLSILMISPAFLISSNSFFLATIGTNSLHTGFAIAILLVTNKGASKIIRHPAMVKAGQVIRFIGINSYSIYLWHLLVKDLTNEVTLSVIPNTILFFAFAILTGIATSLLVEKYFLKIRERFYPAVSRGISVVKQEDRLTNEIHK